MQQALLSSVRQGSTSVGPGELGEAVLSGRSGRQSGCGPPGVTGAAAGAETVGGRVPAVLSPGLMVGQHGCFFSFLFSTFSWLGEFVGRREGADAKRKACARAPTCLTSSSVF